jgi:hypothetical protein
MNSRERMLSIVLGVILGGGVLLFGGYFWFKKPLDTYNATIRSLQDEVDKKQFEFDTFQMERKKLVLARAKSLPPNPAEATNLYQIYLQHVLTSSGLSVEDVSPSQASRMKFQSTVPGIKEVGHQMMTYTVRARGDLASLVKAMEQIQSTPYEHRIKNLSVDRPDMIRDSKESNPKLHINMMVETLLVAKSDAKTGMPPGFDAKYVILDSLAAHGGVAGGWGLLGNMVAIRASMPVPKERSYYEIAMKNIFTGPVEKIQYKDVTVTTEVKVPIERKKDLEPVGPHTPRYVFLTHTDPEQQTAYWRNRVSRGLEQKLVAKPKSGYEHFKIVDDPGDYVFLKAKVIRVDLRTVFFQKEKTIYAWHIGTSLESALENYLDFDQRDILDLQIDMEYAKESLEEKAKKKTTPTKTRTKGR